MEPLTALLSGVARAVGVALGRQLAGPVTERLDRAALQRALGTAFTSTEILARYDADLSFLQHEGAAELAKVLMPGTSASALRLAELCVDSIAPGLDRDERFGHLVRLEPGFRAFLDALAVAVRQEKALAALTQRVDIAAPGRSPAGSDALYRGWVRDQHRYLRTVGMVRNTTVQLRLDDVFVGLTVRRDDQVPAWFEREQRKLLAELAAGRLDQAGFEAALDVLQLRAGLAPASAEPVLDAARRHQHLLVLGDPGSGKTTLLRYLACTAEERFPVYVRIADFARSPHRSAGLRAFLAPHARSLECHEPGLDALIATRLGEGACLILLDGLDEVASAEDRRVVVDAVANFVAAHTRQGNRFVVTSRISGYLAAPLPAPFAAFRLQEMDDDTVDRFLAVYCRAVERAETPDRPTSMIESAGAAEAAAIGLALRENPGVRRLAANPLLLTALVLVHRARGRLPHRRVEAYVEVCEALTRTWRSVQGVPEADLPDERMVTRWLTTLGDWIHRHKPEGSASRRDMLAVLGPLWATHHGVAWSPEISDMSDPLDSDAGHGVLDFLDKVERHTGLLVERAPGRYGFPHLTFEEYYAGRALAFGGVAAERAARIRERLHDPRWEEPILLALGLVARDQPEEIERLIADAFRPGRYAHVLGHELLFLLRVLADDPPLDATVIDRVVRQIVDGWIDRTGPWRFARFRTSVRDRVKGWRGTKAAHRLSLIIGDRADELSRDRPFAFGSLATLTGLHDATAAALVRLLGHPDDDVRAATLRLLRDDAEPHPITGRALRDLALDDAADDSGRCDALAALARAEMLDTALIDAAARLIKVPSGTTRFEVITALSAGPLGPPAVSLLADAAQRPDDQWFSLRAVMALASPWEPAEARVAALTGIAADAPDEQVRACATGVLLAEEAQAGRMIAATRDLMRSAQDPLTQRTVLLALKDHGRWPAEVTAFLTELVAAAHTTDVRLTALEVLAGAGHAVAVPADLVAAVHDDVEMIGELLDTVLLPPSLLGQAAHFAGHAPDRATRDGLVEALVAAGPPARPGLIELALSDGDRSARATAIGVLADEGELAAAVGDAASALARESPPGYPRVAALGALARAGHSVDRAEVAELVSAVTGPSGPEARIAAIRALARVRPTTTVLMTLLDLYGADVEPDARAAAGASLATIVTARPVLAEEVSALLAGHADTLAADPPPAWPLHRQEHAREALSLIRSLYID